MTGGWAITGAVALAAVALAGCTSPSGASTHSAASAMSSAPSPKPSPKPSPTALSTAEVASMVRTLYYGESQAFQRSLQDGFEYNLAHDYPGSENKQKFLACAAKTEAQSQGETASFVPEIGTLAPDPTWVGTSDSSQADWVFAGKKPRGQTYIVTVDSTYKSASGQQDTSTTHSAEQHAYQANLFKLKKAQVMAMGIKCAAAYSFDDCQNLIIGSLEYSWGTFAQACGRIDRVTNKVIKNIYCILHENSIEEVQFETVGLKGDAANLCLRGRRIPRDFKPVDGSEILAKALERFDLSGSTPESQCESNWPQLRKAITNATKTSFKLAA